MTQRVAWARATTAALSIGRHVYYFLHLVSIISVIIRHQLHFPRSGFYYFDNEQKELILASKAAYEKQLGREITTEIAAASDYDK